MTSPAPYLQDHAVTLHHGDCVDVMRGLPDCSVDSVVTDPPYGLEFMGKEWDGADGFRRSLNATDIGRDNAFGRTSRTSPEYRGGRLFGEWCEQWATECLRVLKPGGHMLAFGGSRTWHRLVCGVEDAGFEIRDSIFWIYGSGFPKSLDVGRSVDTELCTLPGKHFWTVEAMSRPGAGDGHVCPMTEQGDEHRGDGTALKPAAEPVMVARKPLAGTVAANVLQHGTGALNIDATRVEAFDSQLAEKYASVQNAGPRNNTVYGSDTRDREGSAPHPAGRWPTNVVLDGSQADNLDRQTGISQSRIGKPRGAASGDGWGMTATGTEYADSGGASRFFPVFRYEAKAPSSERPKGEDGTAHPTVKPLGLMRWLVRLVTPPGGTVLEPFTGSGTTIEACLLEGFDCIAIEENAGYLPLIVQRISKPIQAGFDFDVAAGE